MGKIIRILAVIVLAVLIALTGFQWRNYHKKAECRENALLYFKEEDYEKAISYLEKGLKQMSLFGAEMDEDMSCYLAESYYRLGEYEKTVEIYDSLLEDDEKEEYYLLKAEACAAMKHGDEAVEVLKTGWEKTKSTTFLRKICDSYMEQKDYGKALEYAELGVQAGDKNSAEFLFQEIVIYERSGDFQSAYDAAVQYTTLYPDDEKGLKEMKFLETRI